MHNKRTAGSVSFTTLRRALSGALLLVCLSTVFLDYWSYSATFNAHSDIWNITLRGEDIAPTQFRMGVLRLAEFLTHHSLLALRHAFALIDCIALLIAVFTLRSLLLRSTAFRNATFATQAVAAATFVALLQYALWWTTWYQRPETLPVAALLALSLWLCTHRLRIGVAAQAIALLAIAAALGTTRPDIGLTFHLGIALICLTPLAATNTFGLPRFPQAILSLTAAASCAAIQWYMANIVYPNANYGIHPLHRHAHPLFMLPYNITEPFRLIPFALFLAPTIWLAIQIFRRRFTPSAPQSGLLLGAVIFLCLWCCFGYLDEVRIFLPFALALTPLTVEATLRAFPIAVE